MVSFTSNCDVHHQFYQLVVIDIQTVICCSYSNSNCQILFWYASTARPRFLRRLVSVSFIDYISPAVYLDGTTHLYLNKLCNQSIICAMLISVCSKIYQLGEVPNYWLLHFGMLSSLFIDMIAVKG